MGDVIIGEYKRAREAERSTRIVPFPTPEE
jgi:hypothetical protein